MRWNLTNIIEWVGGAIPGDNYEYLTCEVGGEAHLRTAWTDDSPKTCPECGGQVVVHVPRGERWSITYMIRRDKIFPHRISTWKREGGDYKCWTWRGREFWKKPLERDWLEKSVGIDEDLGS